MFLRRWLDISVFSLVLLSSCWQPTCAQEPVRKYFNVSTVFSYLGEDIRDGRVYHAYLLTSQQSFNLTPRRARLPLIARMELHAGITNFMTGGNRDWELASVAGLETHYTFRNQVRITASLTSGPAFISAVTFKQRRGFIFSNNPVVSVMIPLGQGGWYIRPEYRFRHQSNIGFWRPNGGIDNFFFGIGLGHALRTNDLTDNQDH
ncbi:MAG: acyloxyacyl hydrolase [Saprospiraceae bacterium]|nr:acyloxyacyl hydrolase [Saprospiraceae bacterium]